MSPCPNDTMNPSILQAETVLCDEWEIEVARRLGGTSWCPESLCALTPTAQCRRSVTWAVGLRPLRSFLPPVRGLEPDVGDGRCLGKRLAELAVLRALGSGSGGESLAGSRSWRRILLIDATHLKAPGRESRIWRLHTAFDLLAGRLTDLVVTDRHEAEDLRLLSIASGDLVIADSGYGFRDRIAHVLSVQIALQAHEATLGQTPDPLSQSGERTRQHCHFPVVLVVAGGRSGAGATGSQ